METVILKILQGIVLILVAPIISGWLDWVKAKIQGRHRKWSLIFQPYLELFKLIHIPAVRSKTTSWLFALTPWLLFVSYGLLAFALPLFIDPLLKVDLVIVIYLLGMARFTLALAGLDSGASFGGLGSSREMFFHFLTEIGLFFVSVILVSLWHTANLTEILNYHSAIIPNLIKALSTNDGLAIIALHDLGLIFLSIAFAEILLFETGRIPIDNPSTHLELTMANKAILLEFAGRDLGLLEWAETIKFTFLIGLLGGLFLPVSSNILGGNVVIFILRTFALTIGLAYWEVHQPKRRLGQTPTLAWNAMIFGSLAFVLIALA